MGDESRLARSDRVQVTRRVRFAAGRRLESAQLDEQGNAILFGADRNLHGREFSLLVTLEGEAPRETGMVMDLKALSSLLRSEVVSRLDRTLLNDVEFLTGLPPTSENLAFCIWRRIEPLLPPKSLREICVVESEEKEVHYRGE